MIFPKGLLLWTFFCCFLFCQGSQTKSSLPIDIIVSGVYRRGESKQTATQALAKNGFAIIFGPGSSGQPTVADRGASTAPRNQRAKPPGRRGLSSDSLTKQYLPFIVPNKDVFILTIVSVDSQGYIYGQHVQSMLVR